MTITPPSSARRPEFQPPGNAVAGDIYLGCSGWAYPEWKPRFYPPKTPSARFLEHYAGRLNSVEVNYTFRQLPSKRIVDGWLAQVGPNFRFSFKAPQRITHMQRLNNCSGALAALYAALMPVIAAGRMGLILFQLPPNFQADVERLEHFLEDASASQLRAAFEFRHASWFDDRVYAVLRDHNAALCVAESDDLETPEAITADFSCYRFRKSGYDESVLASLETRLQTSAARGDVFAYFKHEDSPDGALHAEALLGRFAARPGTDAG